MGLRGHDRFCYHCLTLKPSSGYNSHGFPCTQMEPISFSCDKVLDEDSVMTISSPSKFLPEQKMIRLIPSPSPPLFAISLKNRTKDMFSLYFRKFCYTHLLGGGFRDMPLAPPAIYKYFCLIFECKIRFSDKLIFNPWTLLAEWLSKTPQLIAAMDGCKCSTKYACDEKFPIFR